MKYKKKQKLKEKKIQNAHSFSLSLLLSVTKHPLKENNNRQYHYQREKVRGLNVT
jgi:hypothetical protein